MIVLPLWTPASVQAQPATDPTVIQAVETLLKPLDPPKIEEITTPLVKAGRARELKARRIACERAGRVWESNRCTTPVPVFVPLWQPPVALYVATGTLTGSIGYTTPWGNCVNEVPYSKRGYGSPINWPALTQTPYIGAAVLFHYNHTGVITGFWSNGDIEIRHQNGGGLGHRFPRSTFRGYR